MHRYLLIYFSSFFLPNFFTYSCASAREMFSFFCSSLTTKTPQKRFLPSVRSSEYCFQPFT